ncbi:hypothetical protein DPMN_145477 [Dreissena polymorpha]|uniref:Uncharacterized protein n=1 Tax=Dreissena polymorpha TaxID=45954 RepID=A0A9D4J185_DREPO|nr:hypothetical protein DPMN_145477 [Dreissena polymorpha]
MGWDVTVYPSSFYSDGFECALLLACHVAVLDRKLCLVTCPNHASFRRLMVAISGSCGPTNVAVMFRTIMLVFA